MKITSGTRVTLHYVLTVDGVVQASSEGRDPLGYVHGEGSLVPGLEAALVGHEAGDHFRVEVPPSQGYGERMLTGPQPVDRGLLPEGAELVPGMQLRLTKKDGTPAELWVVEVHDDVVWLDFEHPLVGRMLQFEVTVLSVEEVAPA